jgi:hypothetical protein
VNRFLRATHLLLPSWKWTIGYWLAVVVFLLLVANGYETTVDGTTMLWGLKLKGFLYSHTNDLYNVVFVEMANHAWVIFGLPYICFVGTKSLRRSFRSDFKLFMFYSRSPCAYIESVRSVALTTIIALATAPFLLGFVIGWVSLGFDSSQIWNGVASCGALLMFTGAFLHLLASFGFQTEFVVSVALGTPFIVEGFKKTVSSTTFIENYPYLLPPGLPYSISSYADKSIWFAIGFFTFVLLFRTLVTSKTYWLRLSRS